MKVLRKFPYWYLIAVPILLLCLGITSNQAVLVVNHGKFPVAMNAADAQKWCVIPEGIDPADVSSASCAKGGEMIDRVHSVMGPNSHLKALADIFPLGRAIYSIGDGMISLGEALLEITCPYMWIWT